MTPGKSAADPDMRARIVEAAIETLGEDGFAGTTARAIAARGDFNQALIFYYFGSVHALLLEAFHATSEQQVAKYAAAATQVGSLTDLVEIARRLHTEDIESGNVTVVTQLMAAAVSDDALGHAILDRFQGWIGIVETALHHALEGQPLAGMVPVREAAYAICAMFLGVELLTRLGPERSEAEPVFEMMGSIAQLIQNLLPALFPQG